MKKIYLFIFAILISSSSVIAQDLIDDFESYNLGDISPQAAHWRTWSGVGDSTEDSNVVDILANSGFQSLLIDGSGVSDMLLLVPGAPSTGNYTIQWMMYIPAGKEGYFNMQGTLTADGIDWAQFLNGGNVFFNQDGGAPGSGVVDGTPGQVFSYPEDVWFTVTCIYDLDNETWALSIDSVEQFSGQEFTFNDAFVELAAIDFFSVSTGNEYYVDDLILGADLSVDDFASKGFSSYPNPVNDILNLKANENITSVSIFNVLGQQVYQANIDATSSQIDMSQYTSGAYFVKVNIGGTEGTVKVIR